MADILARNDGRNTGISNKDNILPRNGTTKPAQTPAVQTPIETTKPVAAAETAKPAAPAAEPVPDKGFDTIIRCRWCGNVSRTLYIPQFSKGKDGKPMSIIYNYEPCDDCKRKWSEMVVLIETVDKEPYPDCLPIESDNAENNIKIYPTGRHVGITTEVARETIDPNAENGNVFFLDEESFKMAFDDHFNKNKSNA